MKIKLLQMKSKIHFKIYKNKKKIPKKINHR